MLRKFGAYDDELVIRLADGELKHVQLFMRRHQKQQFDLYIIRDISSKKRLSVNERLTKRYLKICLIAPATASLFLMDKVASLTPILPFVQAST